VCDWSLNVLRSVVAACAVLAGERRGPVADVRGDARERAGGDMGLGPMTAQAPAHGEGRRLLDAIHALDGAVATLTGDARDDVLAVIEVDEVGKVVDLGPHDRALLLKRFLEPLDLGRLFLDQRVAVHADAGVRYAGVLAGARAGMTVEAGDLVVAGVNPVREIDRLLRRVSLVDADAGGAAGEQRGAGAPQGEAEDDPANFHQTALPPVCLAAAPGLREICCNHAADFASGRRASSSLRGFARQRTSRSGHSQDSGPRLTHAR